LSKSTQFLLGQVVVECKELELKKHECNITVFDSNELRKPQITNTNEFLRIDLKDEDAIEHYLSFGGVNKNFIKLEHNGIIIYIATGESKTVFGNIRNINKIIVTPVIQRAEVVYTDGDVRKTSILKYEQFVEQMKLVGGIKTYFSLSSEVYGEYVYTKI
jgi:hypothetical protein